MRTTDEGSEGDHGEGQAGTGEVHLRPTVEGDLPTFFAQQLDPVGQSMAAFIPRDPSDREAFVAHWGRILASEASITRTILFDGQVAGYILCFPHSGKLEVGYWVGREYWGRKVATRALRQCLELVTERPIHAGVARDNVASIRVLQKCGFVIAGEGRGFSKARGEEVDELILVLDA